MPPSTSPPPPPRTFLIALSGPTSSGKTTIAGALPSIFASTATTTLVLHADDFYKTDSAIPIHPRTGLQDWDCAAALDLPRFRQVLLDVRAGGDVPAQLVKQGGEEEAADGVHASNTAEAAGVGRGGLDAAFLAGMRERVERTAAATATTAGPTRIVVVEGFLLFGQGVREELGTLFDVRVLLRATREVAGRRRESRNGYVTLEGFWQDPEGYFDDVVWPNYVADHAYLFEGGDVEGKARAGAGAGDDQVLVGPVADVGLRENCEWVTTGIMQALHNLQR